MLHCFAHAQETAQYLIDKGANQKLRNNVGQTAAEYAKDVNKDKVAPPKEGHQPPSQDAAEPSEPPNPLELVLQEFFAAVTAGDVAKVFKMIQNGVHPDVTDKGGNTALVLAVSLGLNSVADALIESGCNLNAANSDGETALALARRADASAVIKGEYHVHRKALVETLEVRGAGEDPSIFVNIHTVKSSSPPQAKSADPLQLHSTPSPERPSTAADRPATAASAATTRPSTASTRPGSASAKRPGTAKKFSTSDLLKSASGLFSVFERSKAQEEVRRLEDDVRGVEKVQAKLAKAEQKAALASEKAEKAHKELMARAEAFLPKVERVRGLLASMKSFDDAKAVLAEGRMLEKEAGLSSDALQKLKWPSQDLDSVAAILEVPLERSFDLASVPE